MKSFDQRNTEAYYEAQIKITCDADFYTRMINHDQDIRKPFAIKNILYWYSRTEEGLGGRYD